MRRLKEDLLQFIWKARLLKPGELRSESGALIEILSTGDQNFDSGPDFSNARVRVDGTLLAGNIEIHIRTSDWTRHHHERDRQYDNIILHVVYRHDKVLPQNTENSVEVLALEKHIDPLTITRYEELTRSGARLPCALQLRHVKDSVFTGWLSRMAAERLHAKASRAEELFTISRNDYVQTLYTMLLSSFGFKVNKVPFELLASRLPAALLLRYADTPVDVEALIFGMSGMLDEPLKHTHPRKLQNAFEFLRKKHKLQPLESKLFKLSKMRPANFPTIRLAQFSALVCSCPSLITQPHAEAKHAYEKLLALRTSSYWQSHYTLTGEETNVPLSLGDQAAESILINAFAPFLYFFGKKTAKPEITAIAGRLLATCKPEKNFKTRMFIVKSPLVKTASESQALIHLYDNYCTARRCMNCNIATSLLQPG